MSVEFSEEDKFNNTFETKQDTTSGITKWIINNKMAKNENGARVIMNIITVICFALSIYFLIR